MAKRNYKELFGVNYPSVTEILSYYPKGIGFYKWLALNGWDESERIKEEAGKRGNNIHDRIEDFLLTSNVSEIGLSSIERDLFNAFINWFNKLKLEHRVEVIEVEKPVINKEHQYVGTIDLILKIDNIYWIIDVKTSNYVHKTHELQLSAYKHAMEFDVPKEVNVRPGYGYRNMTLYSLGILHLKTNKFIEVKDNFEVFLACKTICDFESGI